MIWTVGQSPLWAKVQAKDANTAVGLAFGRSTDRGRGGKFVFIGVLSADKLMAAPVNTNQNFIGAEHNADGHDSQEEYEACELCHPKAEMRPGR